MTEKAKAVLICLIALFIFLGGCIALIGWDEFNAPVETPRRPSKPSFEERYQRRMKENILELEKKLREP